MTIKSIDNYKLSCLTNHFLSFITAQEKKILIVVAIFLSCIAACYYLMRHYQFKATIQPLKPLEIKCKTVEGSFDGDFANNHFAPTGQGKIIYSDGKKEEGQFFEGGLYGQGKITHANQIEEEGEFLDGWLHGKGKKTYPDKTIEEGEFRCGKLHGAGMRIFPNGEKEQGYFIMGTLQKNQPPIDLAFTFLSSKITPFLNKKEMAFLAQTSKDNHFLIADSIDSGKDDHSE